MNSVVFIGHSECYGISVKKLEEAIIKYINQGAESFYNGGQGGFDYLSAKTVYKLKLKYSHIKNF